MPTGINELQVMRTNHLSCSFPSWNERHVYVPVFGLLTS